MSAKLKRITIGSVCKSKDDDKKSYFKVRGETAKEFANALLKMDPEKGGTIRLETKAEQLKSLEDAVTAGKLSAESAAKARERINKIPDYVRCEASIYVDVA